MHKVKKFEIISLFVLYLIFLGRTISLEMVFGNVLDRKQVFLDYKNAVFRSLATLNFFYRG